MICDRARKSAAMSDVGTYSGGAAMTCYQPSPSPSDSGVMSPMTPMSNYTSSSGLSGMGGPGSTPEQSLMSPEHFPGALSCAPGSVLSTSSASSPYNHPSPADSGFHPQTYVGGGCSNAGFFPVDSPGVAAAVHTHEEFTQPQYQCSVNQTQQQCFDAYSTCGNNMWMSQQHQQHDHHQSISRGGVSQGLVFNNSHNQLSSSQWSDCNSSGLVNGGCDAPSFSSSNLDHQQDQMIQEGGEMLTYDGINQIGEDALGEDALMALLNDDGAEDKDDDDEDEDDDGHVAESASGSSYSPGGRLLPLQQQQPAQQPFFDSPEAINRMDLHSSCHQRKSAASSTSAGAATASEGARALLSQSISSARYPATAAASSSSVVLSSANLGPTRASTATSAMSTYQRHGSSKKKRHRSSNKAVVMGGANIVMQLQPQQHYVSVQSSAVGPPDLDGMYGGGAPNVSPDSGIQSEGVASSPLHLGELAPQPVALTQQQAQQFHPAFQTYGGTTVAPLHHHQQQQQQNSQQCGQLAMWNIMQQHQPQAQASYYGHYQSPYTLQTQTYQYNQNSSLNILTTAGTPRIVVPSYPHNQHLQQQQLAQQKLPTGATMSQFQSRSSDDNSAPPVLFPAVYSASSRYTQAQQPQQPQPQQHRFVQSTSSSTSSHRPWPKGGRKRGPGRPKGSKNKSGESVNISVGPKKVTMECGSQTDEFLGDLRGNSTDSDTSSSGSVPPPLPLFMGAASAKVTGSRGRPRKNPPKLLPAVTARVPPVGQKRININSSPPEQSKSKVVVEDDHEVITLDSDEEDVDHRYSDEEEPRPRPKSVSSSHHHKSSKSVEKKAKTKHHRHPKPSSSSHSKVNSARSGKSPLVSPVPSRSSDYRSQSDHRQLKVQCQDKSKEYRTQGRMSRHEVYITEKSIFKTSKAGSFGKGDIQPIFGRKYQTLHPDKFWKSPAHSVSSDRITLVSRTSSSDSVRVLTKASLKEMPSASPVPAVNVGGASTKTMLSVLAEANRKGKPGRKKRGRKKLSELGGLKQSLHHRSKAQQHHRRYDSPTGSGYNSSRSPMVSRGSSVDGHSKKKKKDKKREKKEKLPGWKSKHKNVIDPVFLSEVEHLIQDMSSCEIARRASLDMDKYRELLPTIFRCRVIPVGSNVLRGKKSSSDGQERRRTGQGKGRRQLSSRTASPTVTVHSVSDPDVLVAHDADIAEQRLPLKKRHHHNIPKGAEDASENVMSPPLPASAAAPSSSGASYRRPASSASSIGSNVSVDSRKSLSPALSSRKTSRDDGKGRKDSPRHKSRADESVKRNGKCNRSPLLLTTVTGESPSKPLPPNGEVEPAANPLTMMATCVAKFTSSKMFPRGAKNSSATTPLSVRVDDKQQKSSAKTNSPRKRHLLTMSEADDPPPPTLEKAVSRPTSSLKISIVNSRVVEPSEPTLDKEASTPSSSPPRLSPPHISGGNRSSSEDEAFSKWRGPSSDEDERKRKMKTAHRSRPKYSDISDEDDDDFFAARPDPRQRTLDTNSIFNRLQQQDEARRQNSLPARGATPHVFSHLNHSPSGDEPQVGGKRQRTAADASSGMASLSVAEAAPVLEKEKERPRKKPRGRKNGLNGPSAPIEDALEVQCGENDIEPTAEIVRPRIIRISKTSPAHSPSSATSSSDERAHNLQHCSVRVQKLTEQEIIESSPSPPNLLENHDDEDISEPPPPRSETVTPLALKRRKRRANRTGFPCVKKKRSSSTASPAPVGRPRKIKHSALTDNGDIEPVKISRNNDAVPIRASKRQQIVAEEQQKKKEEKAKEEAEKKKAKEGADVFRQALSKLAADATIKRPRGRPAKRRVEAMLPPVASHDESPLTSRDNSLTNSIQSSDDLASFARPVRSRLYEDIDDEVDCLSLLPSIGMESGQSSETPSGTEADDNSTSSSLDKSKKKKGGGEPQARFKKNYLTAGLFSEDFKRDEGLESSETSNASSASLAGVKKAPVYNPEDHPHGLLPPPYYCGRQLRQKREDFQLPYDLWWLHAHKQLPGRDVTVTWNYKRIKNSVYFDARPVSQDESEACKCRLPPDEALPACGEDCINRMTLVECDPRLCPMQDRCSNNAIQKHRSLQQCLERFMTEKKGWGIRSKAQIPSGEFIIEYVGEVVSEREFKRRMVHEYVEDSHHYCLHMDSGVVIDGHRMGGECRFVNHSCEPNCEIQKWSVNGINRMALFSLRDIQPGEELSYDYNFSLFNPHEGQACQCGSEKCRGVIGGRSQRINDEQNGGDRSASASRDRKRNNRAAKTSALGGAGARLALLAPMKQLSQQQKAFVAEHRCFLLRNLEKVREMREALQRRVNGHLSSRKDEAVAARPEDMILTGLTALATARSMQTRRLTIAQDDPNVTKVVKLAQLLREIFAQVTSIHDDGGAPLSRVLSSLPSRKKHPGYFVHISDPIDLQFIDRTINTGSYTSADQFDRDLLRLCQNTLRYFGHHSKEGGAALKMRRMYNVVKQEYHAALTEIVGVAAAACFGRCEDTPVDEDVIRCPCGQFTDEGDMVQCDQCHVWQHCDCVGQNIPLKEEDSFLCEKCGDRSPVLDIVLNPQPEYASPGEVYYVSLMREDLQVRLGDTVYVLRAFKKNAIAPDTEPEIPTPPTEAEVQPVSEPEKPTQESNEVESPINEIEAPSPAEANEESAEKSKAFSHGGVPHKLMSPLKGPSLEASTLTKGNYPTYKTVDSSISTADMDIFRVERLWVNEKGERFAFGHHYLRPQETFHEPSRKFFGNEVFRVPFYEVLPLDTIWGQCWVLDLPTYCRGRPIGAVDEHVYICEYRVDKTARLFNKISRPKYPVCTKQYAFDNFDQKLRPQRSFTPHEVPEKFKSCTPRSRSLEDDRQSVKSDASTQPSSSAQNRKSKATPGFQFAGAKAAVIKAKSRVKQRTKLEATLQKLLSQQPPNAMIDATYLLETTDKRLRKKPANLS